MTRTQILVGAIELLLCDLVWRAKNAPAKSADVSRLIDDRGATIHILDRCLTAGTEPVQAMACSQMSFRIRSPYRQAFNALLDLAMVFSKDFEGSLLCCCHVAHSAQTRRSSTVSPPRFKSASSRSFRRAWRSPRGRPPAPIWPKYARSLAITARC